MAHAQGSYYVPHGTKWPIMGSIGLFTLMIGAATWLNDAAIGEAVLWVGVAILVMMMVGWFGQVIRESESGTYNAQVDTSFRMGMIWFIFSEVMFFAAFFGALFYARALVAPWLGGAGDGASTNAVLWPGYEAAWPTNGPANVGGAFQTIPAFDLPLINTLILLTSGLTITLAHHALKDGKRTALIVWQAATFLLGLFFVYLQGTEYVHAYHELGLTLGSCCCL